MRHIIYATIITLLFIALFAFNSMSQTNFTGTWNLKEKQHINGPDYANGAPAAFTVDQSKDSIFIFTPEDNSRVSFPRDGKMITTKGKTSGRKIIRGLKWSEDKKTVIFTSEIYRVDNENEIELTRIDEWKLSPDEKQLNFHRRSVETITESWEVKATYDKQ